MTYTVSSGTLNSSIPYHTYSYMLHIHQLYLLCNPSLVLQYFLPARRRFCI